MGGRADSPRCAYSINTKGGIKVRVPDFIRISLDFRISWGQKITMFWGGQDIPQNKGDDSVRKKHPEFFCHKYAYNKDSLKKLLSQVGFKVTYCKGEGTNIWVHTIK